MTSKAAYSIRTLEQAYAFVLQVRICGIFSDANTGLVSLWDVTDLPDRKKGEKGWGQKVLAIWRWKNELPALYPNGIFYGKIPPGRAALMSLDYLGRSIIEIIIDRSMSAVLWANQILSADSLRSDDDRRNAKSNGDD